MKEKRKQNPSQVTPGQRLLAHRYAQGGEGNPFFKIMVIK
jgi:hypothetical protein